MRTEATYNPADTNAGEKFMSFMERGQRYRLNEEQAEMQRESFERQKRIQDELLPIARVKNEADVAVAKSTLEGVKRTQELRARSGNELPAAQAEFDDALNLPTFEARSVALSRIHNKYGWMTQVPEGKGFIDMVAGRQLQEHNNYMLDSKLDEQRRRNDQQYQADLARIEQAGQIAEENNRLKKEKQELDKQFREAELKLGQMRIEVERIKAEKGKGSKRNPFANPVVDSQQTTAQPRVPLAPASADASPVSPVSPASPVEEVSPVSPVSPSVTIDVNKLNF